MLFIVGCNEAQKNPQQQKLLESKDLQGIYKDAYKATLQVLQDYGYAIKNTDYESGVIHGETGMKVDWFLMKWSEITVTLEQFGDNTVKARLTVLNKERVSSQYGTSEKSKVVEDPALFSKIYDDIQKEMFIRQNINK
jgi:hypothetical protein